MKPETYRLIFNSLVNSYHYSKIESLLEKHHSKYEVFKNECGSLMDKGVNDALALAAILKIAFEKYERQKDGANILKGLNM